MGEGELPAKTIRVRTTRPPRALAQLGGIVASMLQFVILLLRQWVDQLKIGLS